MTRNEEIRKEALNWKIDDNEFIAQIAFEAGARWADEHPKSPWISPSVKLPDPHEKPFVTRTPSDDEEDGCKHEYIEPIEDGVYIVEDGSMPVRFNGAKSVPSPKLCDVMVSYHGHNWIVAKEDLKGDGLPLLSDDSHPECTSSFYKCEIEALNDFDMKSCTEHFRKAGIAFELDADLYIPTAGQLAAMFLFRKELNKTLEMVGGTPMKEDVYWSSSECYAWYSWYVNFDSGYITNWYTKYFDFFVRPCMAFGLKKK